METNSLDNFESEDQMVKSYWGDMSGKELEKELLKKARRRNE